MPFLLPAAVKGFHDYFKLTGVAADVLEGFGYDFAAERLNLAESSEPLPWVSTLQERLEFVLRTLVLDSEMARREFLIAPILFEIVLHFPFEIRTEYGIFVSSQLKGTLDYFLRSANGAGGHAAEPNLLIVEAKQADMTRGFTQLSAELVALDKWTKSDTPVLYGAVSVGNLWQFGALYRAEKKVVQDVRVYTVPDNLDALLRVLIAILHPPSPA